LTTWLIDTALFKSLAPAPSRSFRNWIEAHEDPIFISGASLVEIRGAIAKIPPSRAQRAEALSNWLVGLVSGFGDRIYPVNHEIALRAGELLPHCHAGQPRHRFHDAVIAATAQVYGHGLLTKREGVFGPWIKVKVVSP
jgi:predicted nucleic acid-binding protein